MQDVWGNALIVHQHKGYKSKLLGKAAMLGVEAISVNISEQQPRPHMRAFPQHKSPKSAGESQYQPFSHHLMEMSGKY